MNNHLNMTSIKTISLALTFLAICILLVACQASGTAVREFDAQASDVRLHGRIAGNPNSGCVLIAINGGPGLTSNYMLDLEQLAGPDCAVVTYDQRGMGKSSEPPIPDSPESYTLLKYAQDVEAIRLEIKAERIHLFGHSFGGIVAMQYAILYPEQVESLVFFGGGPPTWEDIESSQKNFTERLQSLIQTGVIPSPDQWTGEGIDPLLPAYFSDPNFTFPADSLGGAPEFNQVVNELTYANLRKLDLRGELASLQKRVLLMLGRDDPFGLQMAEATRQALTNSAVEFEVIDQCGHFWHECPDAFYPRLREFLGISRGTSFQLSPNPVLTQSASGQSCNAELTPGCTVFTVSKGDRVFFGGNDDYINPDSYYWVDPGDATNYGVIWIGTPDNVQQGVNEKGLAYDANGLPRVGTNPHLEREPVSGDYTSYPIRILHECATVNEVIAWVNTHQWHTFMRDQMQFADATGDAVIISAGTDGEVVFTRKPAGDSFLVSTNFNVANPNNGFYPCSRYETATRRLDNYSIGRENLPSRTPPTCWMPSIRREAPAGR